MKIRSKIITSSRSSFIKVAIFFIANPSFRNYPLVQSTFFSGLAFEYESQNALTKREQNLIL